LSFRSSMIRWRLETTAWVLRLLDAHHISPLWSHSSWWWSTRWNEQEALGWGKLRS
jgi:hypothetical protein